MHLRQKAYVLANESRRACSVRQAAKVVERALTQHTVDVPREPPADAPQRPDPRPYAALARSQPDGAASLPQGTFRQILRTYF